MSQELVSASALLCSALDQYIQAYSSARDACPSRGSNQELLKSFETESSAMESHIQKLKDARTTIRTARDSILNCRAAVINELPVEVLARIFRFVLPGHSCLVLRGPEKKISAIKYPLYPDALAHVCSRWRRVASFTPSLWTHIDIALDHPLNPGLFARAQVYTARAGRVPLEIHISDPGSERERNYRGFQSGHPEYNPPQDWNDLNDFKFLVSKTAPIKSLEFDLYVRSRYRNTYYSVIEYFFAHSTPGVLTEYNAWFVGSDIFFNSPFIMPTETHTPNGTLIAGPVTHLEELWLRVSIVRINGLCPHYKSKLYHGLIELYISRGAPDIADSQIVNILRSCPKLQVFHLNTPVVYYTDEEETIKSIALEDLRDINLMTKCDDDFDLRILGWIAPGSGPLRLGVDYWSTPDSELESFFSRANVKSLVARWGSVSLIPALKHSRQIDILALNGFDYGVRDLSSLLGRNHHSNGGGDAHLEVAPALSSLSFIKIDTLYLLWHEEFAFEDIQTVVEKYSVQRLFIFNGQLSFQTDEGRAVCDNTRNIRAKLATITGCVTIEYCQDIYSEMGASIDPDDWVNVGAWSRFQRQ